MASEEDTLAKAQEVIERCEQHILDDAGGNEAEGDVDDTNTTATPFICTASARRYLRGYHNDVRKSSRNLYGTYLYRKQLAIDSIGKNESTNTMVWGEIKKRNLFIAIEDDVDNEHSPILVIRKRREAFDIADFEAFRKSFFFLLDCTAKIADYNIDSNDKQLGKWIIIMDMSDFKNSNSPPRSVTTETMKIFQSHFPERARQIIVYNAPRAFSILFACVSPFIDAVTKRKFIFLNSATDAARIAKMSTALQQALSMSLEQGKQNMVDILVKHDMISKVDTQCDDVQNQDVQVEA